jgi:transposase
MSKFTIDNFNAHFPDNNACLEYLKNKLYPNGIYCKICNKITKHHKVKSRPSYSCDRCGHHVHPTADTIFHRSTTSLKNWFYAMYLMSATRCGISAKQLQRELGVTYKTAWRMFNKIRDMLYQKPTKRSGTFEADETYVGGRRYGTGKVGRGAENKSIVFGIINRKGKLICKKIANVKADTLIPLIKENVTPNAVIYTDEYPSYKKLSQLGYKHEFIHHLDKVYVINDVHINSIEGFWSLFKRGINGVYHSVSPKHLQKYVNEYVFRYNNREEIIPMFYQMISCVSKTSRV